MKNATYGFFTAVLALVVFAVSFTDCDEIRHPVSPSTELAPAASAGSQMIEAGIPPAGIDTNYRPATILHRKAMNWTAVKASWQQDVRYRVEIGPDSQFYLVNDAGTYLNAKQTIAISVDDQMPDDNPVLHTNCVVAAEMMRQGQVGSVDVDPYLDAMAAGKSWSLNHGLQAKEPDLPTNDSIATPYSLGGIQFELLRNSKRLEKYNYQNKTVLAEPGPFRMFYEIPRPKGKFISPCDFYFQWPDSTGTPVVVSTEFIPAFIKDLTGSSEHAIDVKVSIIAAAYEQAYYNNPHAIDIADRMMRQMLNGNGFDEYVKFVSLSQSDDGFIIRVKK